QPGLGGRPFLDHSVDAQGVLGVLTNKTGVEPLLRPTGATAAAPTATRTGPAAASTTATAETSFGRSFAERDLDLLLLLAAEDAELDLVARLLRLEGGAQVVGLGQRLAVETRDHVIGLQPR